MTRKEIFEGKEKDDKGKIHDIYREICMKCKKVVSEYHRGCCGYVSNGFMETEHRCEKMTRIRYCRDCGEQMTEVRAGWFNDRTGEPEYLLRCFNPKCYWGKENIKLYSRRRGNQSII